jgi:HlyD family secretion protein
VGNSEAAVRQAEQKLADLQSGPSTGDIANAQNQVESAAAQLISAQARLDQVVEGPVDSDIRAAEASVESAKSNFLSAIGKLTDLEAGPTESDLTAAEASVQSAKSSLQSTISKLAAIRSGFEVEAAEASVESARSNYLSAIGKLTVLEAGPTEPDLRAAEASVESAKSGYQSAVSRLATLKSGSEMEAAEAAVESAKSGYQSAMSKLVSLKSGIKEADLHQASSQVSNAKVALNQRLGLVSKTDRSLSEENVRQAEISLKQAELDLKNTVLLAPFTGFVTSFVPNVGEQVGGTAGAATISDPGSLRVEISLNEVDVPRVSVGQAVELRIDALPNLPLTGTVLSISPVANSQQGVVSYPVTIELSGPRQALSAGTGGQGQPQVGTRPQRPAGAGQGQRSGSDRPQQAPSDVGASRAQFAAGAANRALQLPAGMTVVADIIIARQADVLVVPNAAIIREGQDQFVNLVTPDGTEKRPVQTGMRSETVTEIVAGLSEGDEVLIPSFASGAPGAGAGGGFRGFGGFGGGRPSR